MSVTVAIPKLTESGANGSMTFANGLLAGMTNPS